MSADSHTVCPKCSPEALQTDGPLYPSGPVRENYQTYINVTDGLLVLHHEYRADCWDCGWHFETELTAPIPPVKS